jgi:ABC-type transport system involved in multi-copper enzyme maturation permease subunit
MNVITAIAGIVIKEMYRRKDFYVLFVLTVLITLVMGSMNFFNDSGIVRYLKEVCLWLIWIASFVITIGTTARQIPAERENRTIFPLLAKPVSRAQVLLGKFLGCWLACGLALLVFYIFFGAFACLREHQWNVLSYLQGFWLQWAMLGIVTAFVLFGSIVFAAPSSNATISFILAIGILLLGGYLGKVADNQAEPLRSIVDSIYYLIPHLEWYDIRPRVMFNQGLVSWGYCGFVTFYAALYSAFLLVAAWLAFRRKPLSL